MSDEERRFYQEQIRYFRDKVEALDRRVKELESRPPSSGGERLLRNGS